MTGGKVAELHLREKEEMKMATWIRRKPGETTGMPEKGKVGGKVARKGARTCLKGVEGMKKAAWKHRKILREGTFVAIDPSSASKKADGSGSLPGYAIFSKGEFVEQGVIEVTHKPDLNYRLQAIAASVRTHLAPIASLLVIEKTPDIPLYTRGAASAVPGRIFMTIKQISSLKQAIGAIKGAFSFFTPVIEAPAISWKSIVKKIPGYEYKKDDDNDARAIGDAIMFLLNQGEKKDV